MEWILAALAAAGAIAIGWMSASSQTLSKAADGAAALAVLALGAAAGAGIMRTILHGTLYMTEIHSVLESPALWLGGSYLVVYTVGRLGMAVFFAGERSR